MYRLYNQWSGDHFYTANYGEYEHLHSLGWSQEGIAFFSADKDTGAPIHRLFNRWFARDTHLFTTDKSEYDNLVKIGRSGEGIALRALEKVLGREALDIDASKDRCGPGRTIRPGPIESVPSNLILQTIVYVQSSCAIVHVIPREACNPYRLRIPYF